MKTVNLSTDLRVILCNGYDATMSSKRKKPVSRGYWCFGDGSHILMGNGSKIIL